MTMLSGIFFLQLAGLAYCGWLLEKRNSIQEWQVPAFSFYDPVWFTIKLAVIVFAACWLVYGLTGHAGFLFSLASFCAFLLPALVLRTWWQFQAIPQREFSSWYPQEAGVVPIGKFSGERIQLQFQIFMDQSSDIAPATLAASLPAKEYLGKAFHDCLATHNKKSSAPVDLLTEDGKAYGWQFYLIRMNGWSEQYLNPKQVLWKLSLNDGAVISARRSGIQQALTYRMKV